MRQSWKHQLERVHRAQELWIKKKKMGRKKKELEGQLGGTDVFEAKDKSLKQSVNLQECPTLKMLGWVWLLRGH